MARLDNHFSWKTATFMAKLAKHAYNKPAAFKKTFKKDVKTLLNIPLFTEEIIYIEQNNIERNIYNNIFSKDTCA